MKVVCHYRNDPERPLTDPLPEPGGRAFIFRLYSGDVCDPIQIGGGNWFKKPYPKRVARFRFTLWYSALHLIAALWVLWCASSLALDWWRQGDVLDLLCTAVVSAVGIIILVTTPGYFVAWRWPSWAPFGLAGRAAYLGWKCYGVDAPEYKQWPVGIRPEDVYPGSLALCSSCRPFARIS